jgi:hypothetical protein
MLCFDFVVDYETKTERSTRLTYTLFLFGLEHRVTTFLARVFSVVVLVQDRTTSLTVRPLKF